MALLQMLMHNSTAGVQVNTNKVKNKAAKTKAALEGC